jgi:hypothetical protein
MRMIVNIEKAPHDVECQVRIALSPSFARSVSFQVNGCLNYRHRNAAIALKLYFDETGAAIVNPVSEVVNFSAPFSHDEDSRPWVATRRATLQV